MSGEAGGGWGRGGGGGGGGGDSSSTQPAVEEDTLAEDTEECVTIQCIEEMSMYMCIYTRQLILLLKSDCLGCVVLLCLVVCMTLLASFFLPYASLINMYL